MSERMDRKLVDGMTQLITTASISAILVEEMGEKLTELMGEEAFDEWGEPILEEAERVAQAEVEQMEAEAKAIRAMSEGVCVS